MLPSRAATAAPSQQSLKPPVGISDFGELYREGYTFVDKTPLIREILDDSAKVTLIVRPRRFGKTLNLSMLHHFFASEVRGHSTRRMFQGLVISDDHEAMACQGQRPVIFVTLKDIKQSTFSATLAAFSQMLSLLFSEHRKVLNSPRLSPEQLRNFQLVLDEQASAVNLSSSLKLLCDCLSAHHGQPVMLLIDEYDGPMHAAHTHGYFDDMAQFMRIFLGAALKDNSSLRKAVVTGILRISRESLFSGLNNIEVNTVLDRHYDCWFGFTETDVALLLQLLSNQMPQAEGLGERIRTWYNGYRFGERVIYNPWSIINCLKNDGETGPYWVNTSDNALLKEMMGRAAADLKKELERFLRGETLQKTIDPKLVFSDLSRGTDGLWSLLLFTGYLTASQAEPDRRGYVTCQLRVPNQEVLGLYERNIREWFTDGMTAEGYAAFLASLLECRLDEFKSRLEEYLRDSMSVFDTSGHHPEKFYHGLVLGLMFGLRETHVVFSNRESGFGRYDIALLPRKINELGFILEFKRELEPQKLEAAADQALLQIDERWYEAELRNHGVDHVMKIGMAFAGKQVALRSALAPNAGSAAAPHPQGERPFNEMRRLGSAPEV